MMPTVMVRGIEGWSRRAGISMPARASSWTAAYGINPQTSLYFTTSLIAEIVSISILMFS